MIVFCTLLSRVIPSLGSSHTSINKCLGYIDNASFAVSSVLLLSIAHLYRLFPATHQKSLSSFGNTSASTALTTTSKGAKLDFTVMSSISSDHHVLFVANSNTALLSTFSITCSGFHESRVFMAWNFLGGTILLRHVEFIRSKLESLGSGPSSTIVTVDSSEATNVSDSPCISGRVKLVLNLMNVGIPRHVKYT